MKFSGLFITIINRRINICLVDNVDLPESLLEDVKVRACFVSNIQRANRLWRRQEKGSDEAPLEDGYVEASFSCPLGNKFGNQNVYIPSRIRETAVEDLFTGDEDNITLQTLMLDALRLTPIDCRK